MAAGVALLDVSSECGRAAALDGTHDAALTAAECRGVVATIGRPELAEDVRQLEPRGAQDGDSQKWAGGATGGGTTGAGNQSSGLRVAHTVLVATFR